ATRTPTLFPYTTLFRSHHRIRLLQRRQRRIAKTMAAHLRQVARQQVADQRTAHALGGHPRHWRKVIVTFRHSRGRIPDPHEELRSEEHTSELQSRAYLV